MVRAKARRAGSLPARGLRADISGGVARRGAGARGRARGGAAGAFGQQLWRSAKWAGRALDFGAGRERGARSDEASAVERALEGSVAAKAEALVAEDAPPAPPLGDLPDDSEGTYEGGYKA